MSEHVAFCSAVDRPVPVAPLPAAPDRAADDRPQLVCLDYRTRCSGAFCPRVLWIPDEEEGAQPATLVRLSSDPRSPLPRAS